MNLRVKVKNVTNMSLYSKISILKTIQWKHHFLHLCLLAHLLVMTSNSLVLHSIQRNYHILNNTKFGTQ